MVKDQKFFKCEHCGNIIQMIQPSGVSVVCCGEKMTELNVNTSDGATEKHVPEVSINGDDVSVVIGSVPHPMVEEHYIQWIYLVTDQGYQFKYLDPENEPKVSFKLNSSEKVVEVYEYCNLHGLWKVVL